MRGPIHELDYGSYHAVIRNGVPMIERSDSAGCVKACVVPMSLELFAAISADWSAPVQFRIDDDGELVFRAVENE